MVEPPATVEWVSALMLDSLFTALMLSSLKQWSVKPVKKSECTVIVYGSHVKRVINWSLNRLLSAIRSVSYDPLFTALELCVFFKSWLVRPAKSRIILRLPREACFDGAERVETVVGQACQRIGLHCN